MHADDHRRRQCHDDDVVERQSGMARLCPRPIPERLDDRAAEEGGEVVALGKDGEVDRHAQIADDIGDGIGVAIERRNIGGHRDDRLPHDRVAGP